MRVAYSRLGEANPRPGGQRLPPAAGHPPACEPGCTSQLCMGFAEGCLLERAAENDEAEARLKNFFLVRQNIG